MSLRSSNPPANACHSTLPVCSAPACHSPGSSCVACTLFFGNGGQVHGNPPAMQDPSVSRAWQAASGSYRPTARRGGHERAGGGQVILKSNKKNQCRTLNDYFCFFSAVLILVTKILINSFVSSSFHIRCWMLDVRPARNAFVWSW